MKCLLHTLCFFVIIGTFSSILRAEDTGQIVICEFEVDTRKKFESLARVLGEDDFLLAAKLNGIVISESKSLEEVKKILENSGASLRMHRLVKCLVPLRVNPNTLKKLYWVAFEGEMKNGDGVWRGNNSTYALVRKPDEELTGIVSVRPIEIIPTGTPQGR